MGPELRGCIRSRPPKQNTMQDSSANGRCSCLLHYIDAAWEAIEHRIQAGKLGISGKVSTGGFQPHAKDDSYVIIVYAADGATLMIYGACSASSGPRGLLLVSTSSVTSNPLPGNTRHRSPSEMIGLPAPYLNVPIVAPRV
jgi:hypothetical protein